jgi:hypothetical protein
MEANMGITSDDEQHYSIWRGAQPKLSSHFCLKKIGIDGTKLLLKLGKDFVPLRISLNPRTLNWTARVRKEKCYDN